MIDLLDDLRQATILHIDAVIDYDYDYNESDSPDFKFGDLQYWRRDPDPYNLHNISMDLRLKSILGEDNFRHFMQL